MDNQLLTRVEQLRDEMVRTALQFDLQHSEVLHISESLDVLILQVQLERNIQGRKL